MKTFPQASRARANVRRASILAIAFGVLAGAAGVCGIANNWFPGLAALGLGVALLVLGIQWLRTKPFLAVNDTGLSVEGNRVGGENWSLPWSSIGHAKVATPIIGGERRRVLSLYPSRGAPNPLRGIFQGQFDNFEEIVKLVGEQLAKAGHQLEEIEES